MTDYAFYKEALSASGYTVIKTEELEAMKKRIDELEAGLALSEPWEILNGRNWCMHCSHEQSYEGGNFRSDHAPTCIWLIAYLATEKELDERESGERNLIDWYKRGGSCTGS